MIRWIHKKDREAYEKLVHMTGGEPKIEAEDDENILVVFSAQAAEIWINSGYWVG